MKGLEEFLEGGDQKLKEKVVKFGVVNELDWSALVIIADGTVPDRVLLAKILKRLLRDNPDSKLSTTKPFPQSKLY